MSDISVQPTVSYRKHKEYLLNFMAKTTILIVSNDSINEVQQSSMLKVKLTDHKFDR